ncbi:N-acetylated-alpha-linked acidic dipeptidase 2 [Nannizzia gypsea CBS 118893]|uniref:N-acetylated-alpha-linked acidic dipeptidase 2 n=1 Tax=Arthroderma gypseum (strain ATCC MYA-4604 / CBS 118893) TaxID=535722 RepID=E5QZC5_ARTGP|nr:N-acetylated-alpha-linked acidic dipeptidase 2 [Nannizzia gypsea CBS 118893]EFQ98143.1 N-acetylated-alpha-linked acidic dipeptidase 2 [Nannizzia gypsea CBS 118893]
MGDQKVPYEHLPIPTYEEATSSRPSSSQSRLGPREVSDDAERQGLLHNHDTAGERSQRPFLRGYRPPTVESVRSSLDFLSDNGSSARGSTEQLRRELEEMEVEDPPQASSSSSSFAKRFTSFKRTLSSINLPLRKYIPTFTLPSFDFQFNICAGIEHQQRCIIILRVFAVCLVASLVYLLFVSNFFSFSNRINQGQIYQPESVRVFLENHINETAIGQNLERATNFPHIAGTEGNYVLAKWVEENFKSYGLESVELEKFDVYLNYPKDGGRRVAIVDPPEARWEAQIEEDQVYADPPREQTMVFHGLSKSGNVTGPLVYANYGSKEEYKKLADMGVSVKGSIILVRHYGMQPDVALKVKAAELAGAVGCIIYSDPADDGFRKGDPWPKGRFMPKDGVQRGSVNRIAMAAGDVLSPGFASRTDEKKRLKVDEAKGLPQIPSIPLSWKDAQHLLTALKGHGKKVPKDWAGGVPDISEWWTGNEGSPKINLMNLQDEVERQPIYNVIGRIVGVEQSKNTIILGNHRDSWCFGAVEPGSGTAVLLEVARVFGELKARGWRPLRTLEFVSWDAGEYGMIGSTEHVEDRIDFIRPNAFAYLNVDVAVSGDKFSARGSPFCYSNFDWIHKTGDPGFLYHRAMGQIWGLLALELCSRPVFPFDMNRYSKALSQYVLDLHKYAKKISVPLKPLKSQNKNDENKPDNGAVDLQPLYDATNSLNTEVAKFHQWEGNWNATIYDQNGFEDDVSAIRRMAHNTHMGYFETNLLDLDEGGGVPNRTQYKHMIYSPQLWPENPEEATYFPAIRDAMDSGDWTQTQVWIDKVSKIITNAAVNLNQ